MGATISSKSKDNYAIRFGEQTRSFIDKCDQFSMQLADQAESEKSLQLRRWMNQSSGMLGDIVERLETMLESSSSPES